MVSRGLWRGFLHEAAGPRREKREHLHVRPCLQRLEDRVTPSMTIKVGPTAENLISAIKSVTAQSRSILKLHDV